MSCGMKWKLVRARTTKIKRATAPRHGLEHYCRDLNGWPPLMDGAGKRSAARRTTTGLVPSVPRNIWRRRTCRRRRSRNTSITRGLSVANSFAIFMTILLCERKPVERRPPPDDRLRRARSSTRRRRRSAEIVRFHVPEARRFLHRAGSLTLAVTRHENFPTRLIFHSRL